MAKITITIDKVEQADLIEALAERFRYQGTIRKRDPEKGIIDIPNPQSKEQFVQDTLTKRLMTDYREGGSALAADKAKAEFLEKFSD